MEGYTRTEMSEEEYRDARSRVRKIRHFYKRLASWAGTSIFLIALNLFMSGGIGWAKYPVFFWGISIVIQAFQILPLLRLDKAWEERQIRRLTGTNRNTRQASVQDPSQEEQPEDYSEDLLDQPERQTADLSEFRTLSKPWKEEDLV